MGSSGSGKFGTYHVGTGQTTGAYGTANGGGIGSVGGGGTGEVECPDVLENIRLEDVATSDFYLNNNFLPTPSAPVELHNTIYKGRLVIKETFTGEVVGNLPTQYNYIINCIKKGKHYTGTVIAAGMVPVPFVVVTLYA